MKINKHIKDIPINDAAISIISSGSRIRNINFNKIIKNAIINIDKKNIPKTFIINNLF